MEHYLNKTDLFMYDISGTPPRLDGSTINYSGMGVMEPDNPSIPFSFLNDSVWIKVCFFV